MPDFLCNDNVITDSNHSPVCGLVLPRKEIKKLVLSAMFLSYCFKAFLTVNIHLCTNCFICPLFTPFSCKNQTRQKGRLLKWTNLSTKLFFLGGWKNSFDTWNSISEQAAVKRFSHHISWHHPSLLVGDFFKGCCHCRHVLSYYFA